MPQVRPRVCRLEFLSPTRGASFHVSRFDVCDCPLDLTNTLHQASRRHAKFCEYDKSALPSCLSSHAMLPAHPHSGYCDIQGRRRTIEDFHAIRLTPTQQFYGIFDGHTGNLASKYAASFLYDKLDAKVSHLLNASIYDEEVWKRTVEEAVTAVFGEIHNDFLAATSLVPHAYMDQSGTTATAAIVTSTSVTIASLGDSRAVISSYADEGILMAIQLTNDHVASDPLERALVEARGGRVWDTNRISRVEGVLVITRSIGGTMHCLKSSLTSSVVLLSSHSALPIVKTRESVRTYLENHTSLF